MMRGEVENSKIGKNWWDLRENWKGIGKLGKLGLRGEKERGGGGKRSQMDTKR